ncbi:Uncharacterised protein [Klebsiella pneumoniae]|nr:Uncharacterised protein [Klebsiella pneumoniae]VXZ87928.1 Uncharacterised protein [Klebsiella pneumoniae]
MLVDVQMIAANFNLCLHSTNAFLLLLFMR